MGFLFISMSSRPSNFYVIKVFFLQNKSVSNHLKCEIFISVRMLISCQNHLCKEISLSLSLSNYFHLRKFSVCVHEQRTKFSTSNGIEIKVEVWIKSNTNRNEIHRCIQFHSGKSGNLLNPYNY